MMGESKGSATKVAVTAMLIASALSIVYGAYVLYSDGEGAIVFFVAGALLGAFASIVGSRSRKT